MRLYFFTYFQNSFAQILITYTKLLKKTIGSSKAAVFTAEANTFKLSTVINIIISPVMAAAWLVLAHGSKLSVMHFLLQYLPQWSGECIAHSTKQCCFTVSDSFLLISCLLLVSVRKNFGIMLRNRGLSCCQAARCCQNCVLLNTDIFYFLTLLFSIKWHMEKQY